LIQNPEVFAEWADLMYVNNEQLKRENLPVESQESLPEHFFSHTEKVMLSLMDDFEIQQKQNL
jgi:hypothetical protein